MSDVIKSFFKRLIVYFQSRSTSVGLIDIVDVNVLMYQVFMTLKWLREGGPRDPTSVFRALFKIRAPDPIEIYPQLQQIQTNAIYSPAHACPYHLIRISLSSHFISSTPRPNSFLMLSLFSLSFSVTPLNILLNILIMQNNFLLLSYKH